MPFAAFYGHTETAWRVIEITPEVCTVHSVKIALRYGNIEIAQMLLSTASVEAEMTRIHNNILQAEASFTVWNRWGGHPWEQHPLCDAIRIGSQELVQQLLPPGMDPNFQIAKQLSFPSVRSLSQPQFEKVFRSIFERPPFKWPASMVAWTSFAFYESGTDPT